MDINCSWIIKVPDDRAVILAIIDLSLYPSMNCEQSSLTAFDGPSEYSSMLGDRMCGPTVIENIESTGNEIYLLYTSTLMNGTDHFKIAYNISG